MSVVTTLILTVSLNPWGRSDAMVEAESDEAFLAARCPELAGIRDIGYHFGGSKAPQVLLFGGAFNYLDHHKVLEELEALPWEDGDVCQLVVNGEDDEGVQVINVIGQPSTRPFLPG